MKLYELTQNYNQLLDMLNDPDASPEVIQEILAGINEKIEVKAENLAKIVKGMDADIEAIANEIKRLQDNKKSLENKKEGLKRYLQDQLESVGLAKVKTPLFSIGIQNNPPGVEILDEEAIPEEFISYTPSINKNNILTLLKEGKVVPGAQIKQGRSLRIR